jgi:hypothetical protein
MYLTFRRHSPPQSSGVEVGYKLHNHKVVSEDLIAYSAVEAQIIQISEGLIVPVLKG